MVGSVDPAPILRAVTAAAIVLSKAMYDKRNREHERREALRLRGAGGGVPPRCCAWSGCDQEAPYRAPKGREQLREFQWFCLDHIREFNRGWDYFQGMSQAEIERHRRADVTWHRPTWRYGTAYGFGEAWRDVFGLFGDAADRGQAAPRPRSKAEEMLDRLELAGQVTLAELKRRYKQLAKKHHPDLHGGDKAAEERLKLINEAYTYLLDQRFYV
jgi:DnaJ-domain-containing protein 1